MLLWEPPPPKEEWGDPLAMVKKALATCSGVSTEKREVVECYEGIFNVLADWMLFKRFDLKNNPENPLFVCIAQVNADYQRACYYEFGMRLPGYLPDSSLLVVDTFIEHIKDDEIAKMIIDGSAAGLVDNNPSLDKIISIALSCREISSRLQSSCLTGIVGGLMAHGSPGKEYIKAGDFCGSNVLNSNEKRVCYNNLLEKIYDMYTGSKKEEACEYIQAGNLTKECLQGR